MNLQNAKNKLLLSAPVATGLLVLGGQAGAVGTDFSGILTGIDGSTAATAVVAAAAILALVGFAAWGARKVGKFFG